MNTVLFRLSWTQTAAVLRLSHRSRFARTLIAALSGCVLAAAATAATIQGTVLNQNTKRFLERPPCR
ncbi:MAG: hypothetical protein JNK23_24465 [Opitutaceae bacterium]|nr:hypothetical protein [Opitutaceae bacterium]